MQRDGEGLQEQQNMEQKHDYVRRWLEKVFSGEEVPEYEINSHTVDCLYRMAQDSETREREAEVMMEDFEQKAEEYAAETVRLQSEMEWMGFAMSDLSPATLGYVQTLASTATVLGLSDCSDTSFCLSLTELSRQMSANAVKMEEAERETERLQEQIRKALIRDAKHKCTLSDLTREMEANVPVLTRQKKEGEFLRQKAEQYQKLVTSMKEELKESGFEPGLSHGALQHCAKEIEELQNELAPLKAQLASYQDLPPDLSLAKVKVEEKKRELAKLEAELARTIDLVHAEK